MWISGSAPWNPFFDQYKIICLEEGLCRHVHWQFYSLWVRPSCPPASVPWGEKMPSDFHVSGFYKALTDFGIPKFTSCEIPKAWSFLDVIWQVNKNYFMIFFLLGEHGRGWGLRPSTLSFLLWNKMFPRLTLAHPQHLCRSYKINNNEKLCKNISKVTQKMDLKERAYRSQMKIPFFTPVEVPCRFFISNTEYCHWQHNECQYPNHT